MAVFRLEDYGITDPLADHTVQFGLLLLAMATCEDPVLIIDRVVNLPCGFGPITLDGLTIKGRPKGRVNFEAGGQPGLYFKDCNDLSVIGLRVFGQAGATRSDDKFCMFFDNCADVAVKECRTQYGLSGIWMNRSRRVRVSKNVVRDTSADGIHFAAGCQDVAAWGNTVENPKDDHFACTSDKVGVNNPIRSADITFRDNKAVGGLWGSAFAVYDCDDVKIYGNKARDIPGSGVSVTRDQDPTTPNKDIVIRDNDFKNLARVQFLPEGPPYHASGFQSGCGIFVGYSDNPLIQGNKIKGVNGPNTNGNCGIGLHSVSSPSVLDNEISYAKHGIQARDSVSGGDISSNGFYMISDRAIDFQTHTPCMSGRFMFNANRGRAVGHVSGGSFIATSPTWDPGGVCYVTNNVNADGRLLTLLGSTTYVKQQNIPAS